MLSYFDESTVMAQPWAEAGFRCYCIDLQHRFGENVDKHQKNIIRVGADVRDWLPPRGAKIVFSAFFVPCTDLAVSGARWFSEKGLGRLSRALELVHCSARLAELLKAPYFIENPVIRQRQR
jgi:hypothetical protein